MNAKNKNNIKSQSEEDKFIRIFNSTGVLYQSHNESEYQMFLKENYISKTSSYQYLKSF